MRLLEILEMFFVFLSVFFGGGIDCFLLFSVAAKIWLMHSTVWINSTSEVNFIAVERKSVSNLPFISNLQGCQFPKGSATLLAPFAGST